MENTESQIKAAINASATLSAHEIQTAAQGSYKNLTHVPRESDVDIRVVLKGTFFYDLTFADPKSATDDAVREALRRRFDITPATYSYDTFRDDVGAALVARFGGPPSVTAGDKAFGIRETRYHVESDVVAALEHRRYHADGTYDEGVEFATRKGRYITNWPVQQFRNGITKNQSTGERFKAMVRAMKNLRNEMDDEKKPAAAPISSFLIECLVWNVPDQTFGHANYYDDMKEVLRFLYHNTTSDATCSEWGEENELKYLFRASQPWTREQANAFILAAWHHVGFTD